MSNTHQRLNVTELRPGMRILDRDIIATSIRHCPCALPDPDLVTEVRSARKYARIAFGNCALVKVPLDRFVSVTSA
ncbi:hypothetical protein [Nonomuraea endophytica]|uniref:Uncharacterized protein n=1 Tax=Nonomuraea endophytica TaxID=714136 RepID=A0A7W8A981_9ACTN|nr:hypothetical protein [Nonomuraea endophytica]MBB5081349.1 hypothetical protein [Nonomuraea endophytica]